MPRDGALTWSDVREPTLTIACKRCGRYGRYSVKRLIAAHGADAKAIHVLRRSLIVRYIVLQMIGATIAPHARSTGIVTVLPACELSRNWLARAYAEYQLSRLPLPRPRSFGRRPGLSARR